MKDTVAAAAAVGVLVVVSSCSSERWVALAVLVVEGSDSMEDAWKAAETF